MEPVRKILVATDFSEVADQAIDAAGVLAAKLGAQVLLVHARPAVADEAFGDLPPEMRTYTRGLRARLEQEAADAAEELERRAARLPAGVAAKTAMLVGRIAEAVVREARQSKVDLVVLGTHGRGAVGRAILGSVAHELLRTSPIPVLLVGPHAGER